MTPHHSQAHIKTFDMLSKSIEALTLGHHMQNIRRMILLHNSCTRLVNKKFKSKTESPLKWPKIQNT